MSQVKAQVGAHRKYAQRQAKGNNENKEKVTYFVEQKPYVSVLEAIITKAKVACNLDEKVVYHEMERILTYLIRHAEEKLMDLLTDQDLYWWSEVIYWEYLFPNEKEAFPGVRPERPAGVRRFPPGYNPVCAACTESARPGFRCPFVRLLPCPSGIHGVTPQRLGYEWDEDVGCPECWMQDREDARLAALAEALAGIEESEEQPNKRQRLRY